MARLLSIATRRMKGHRSPPSRMPVVSLLARRRLVALAVVSLHLSILPTGCTLPRRTFEPVCDPAQLDDVGFVHYLATVPTLTVEEGVRAVLLLRGSTSQWPTYELQSAELLRLGALSDRWTLRAGDTLDKGSLAFMLRTVCRLPRSFNELLATSTGLLQRRYALKNCVDRGLLSHGLPTDPVTGGEMLSTLTTAERIIGPWTPAPDRLPGS